MKANTADLDRIRSIKTLPQLIAYLRDDLEWPIGSDDVEEITFDYDPEELGFDTSSAVEIKEIKQIRPLETKQPWGIFWINFEKKHLPVVMLRRILAHLAIKKRPSAKRGDKAAWHPHDLLFISSYGEEQDRAVTFAHFWQDDESVSNLPVLKVLGWDGADTVMHLADAHQTLAEKLRWPSDPSDINLWRNKWASAFSLRHREVITTTQELEEELADLAIAIRKRANTILAKESARGPMRRLYSAFKTALIHDLTEDGFADVIAQTISYGLLAAKFSHPKTGITIQNLVDMIPPTNPFLRELLGTFLVVTGRKGNFDFDELGIQDVIDLLNHANIEAVKADFGRRTRDEDPVIHFYEHFLANYDKQKKVQRGVFYTPRPVVSYIVRSVHELLQTEFGIEDGLASPITWGEMIKRNPGFMLPKICVHRPGKAEGEEIEISPDEFFVLVLDPATGTATFLVETIELIFTYLKAKWEKHGPSSMPRIPNWELKAKQCKFIDYWNAYVPTALLQRLYGYELMMAPYTIAHMKLGLKLSEINMRLDQPDLYLETSVRANIYLTNSLEPPVDIKQKEFVIFFPALAHESIAVNEIKRFKRFTIVVGNPPYAYMSSNLTEEASKLIDLYKYVDGQKIVERGAIAFERALQDDYVKFFGLAQRIIDQSGTGCISMITNSAYFRNPNMRGMRNSFMLNFQFFLGLNLHGDLKGLQIGDQNIFDIRTGVAIALLGRKPTKIGTKFYCSLSDITGARTYKEQVLEKSTLQKDCLKSFAPKPLQYIFDLNANQESEYNDWIQISQMFLLTSVGIKSCRDHLVIGYDDKEIVEVLNVFINPTISVSKIKEMLALDDSAQWEITENRKRCRETFSKKYFSDIAYRPFDNRRIYYHPSVVSSPRPAVMQNLIKHNNLAFITNRRIRTEEYAHFFVVNTICMAEMLSSADNCNVYPLMLIEDDLLQQYSARPNFSPYFLKKIAASLNIQQTGINGLPNKITAEQIFYYLYTVFHSPAYRNRYANFLKIDFPRLPLTASLELFRILANLGGELILLHTMKSSKLDKFISKWLGKIPSREIEKVTYSDNTVWIEKTLSEGFRGVPENVWNFHIGGYQVCEKWLKDRKGRKLSKEDIEHYQKIVVALSETIRLMAEIDKVIDTHGGWPQAFK